MKKTVSRGSIVSWVLFALAAMFAIAPVALSWHYAPQYEFFRVPIASWVVFCLCAVLLLLDGVAVWYRIRLRAARQGAQEADRALVELRAKPAQLAIPALYGYECLPRPEFATIVQVLFSHLPNVPYIHLRPLSGGYGGSAVVLARLQRKPGEAPLPRSFVVKLGDQREMAGERGRFLEHVFADALRAPKFFQYAEWQEWAGIAYEFVGLEPDAEVTSFQHFYKGYAAVEVENLIELIYSHLARVWYQAGRQEPGDLYAEYYQLVRKRRKIIENVARIVQEDDPYHINFSAAEKELRPRLVPRFCPDPDLDWYDPISFLRTWPRQGPAVPLWRSVVHGDLNTRNILVEVDQDRQKGVWFIDFSHTGNGLSAEAVEDALQAGVPVNQELGHTLRDFGRLEADVKLLLTRLQSENDLRLALDLERALLDSEAGPLDLPSTPPASTALLDERFKKAWQAVRKIRSMASRYLVNPGDPRPYYWSLLLPTLATVYYQADQFEGEACEVQQKRYALLSAGMLCARL